VSQPNRRDLEPLQTNNTATFLVGIALWAVALVVLLIVQPDPEHRWWIWTCVVGIGGGVFGLWYSRRFDRSQPRPPATPQPPLRDSPPDQPRDHTQTEDPQPSPPRKGTR